MTFIDKLYQERSAPPPEYNDIWEHLPTLKAYAAGREVLELGVRSGWSTTAFLAARPKRLVSIDIATFSLPKEMIDSAAELGIPWERITRDSALPLPPGYRQFDVTFVDTLHTATHVWHEICAHGPRTRMFMIFHDTEALKYVGEDKGPGIWKPIMELVNSGSWKLHQHFPNNNGLTILERVHGKTQ